MAINSKSVETSDGELRSSPGALIGKFADEELSDLLVMTDRDEELSALLVMTDRDEELSALLVMTGRDEELNALLVTTGLTESCETLVFHWLSLLCHGRTCWQIGVTRGHCSPIQSVIDLYCYIVEFASLIITITNLVSNLF